MKGKVRINYNNIDYREYGYGTSLKDVSKDFQDKYEYPILVASIKNTVCHLSEKVLSDQVINFYDRSSKIGNIVYERTLHFMLVVAIKKVLGEDVELIIEHSMDKGVYCEVIGEVVTDSVLRKIEQEIELMANKGLTIEKVQVSRIEAIEHFKSKNQMDKVNLLKYTSNSYVTLFKLEDYYDYFFIDLADNTGVIDEFKFAKTSDIGFVLNYPDINSPEKTKNYDHNEILFDSYIKYTDWGKFIGVSNAPDLNKLISKGKYRSFVNICETYYEEQLGTIADKIYKHHDDIKLVLLAGPTSSGKTTTSKRLETYLNSRGLRTHQVSIDDYFHNRSDTPRDKNGNLDFESVNAIDIDLFNKHMTRLLEGETVLLPEYNFLTGEREYKDRNLKIKEDDVIIVEGLHALNDQMTLTIDSKNKYKIFISPLTHINIDNHNRVHATDIRKLRRIVRDNKYRGYTAADTLRMWEKISEGEELFIYPFQRDVDAIINSSLVYEISVLKIYAEPLLYTISEDDPMYNEAIRLLKFLRNFLPLPSEVVPGDSILREFIGGSVYEN